MPAMPDAPMLSLSTCWCSSRHQDGYEMLREIADLGFGYAELSHGIRVSLVPGILRAVEEGFIKISTTHNFCPLPPGVMTAAPNLYQPSSPNVGERALWRRYTIASLDFAQRVKANVLITHLGSIFYFLFDPSAKVESLAESLEITSLREDVEFQAMIAALLVKLRKAVPKHYARIQDCLADVTAKAQQAGVKFGCENREGLLELPLDEHMDAFLVSVDDLGVCGGWHDTGHACLKHLNGVINHAEFLAKNHKRLLGFHLHDVNNEGSDHQPIGTGLVDWKMIRQYIRPEHILVIELSPRLEREQVVESKAFIEKWLANGV
jgi:sugar phosphate isomerase/epimerase